MGVSIMENVFCLWRNSHQNIGMISKWGDIRKGTECSYLEIQGDSGGICNTLGNDSMCDSRQKSSYEHGSDFERLLRYGKKKMRIILRARTAIT